MLVNPRMSVNRNVRFFLSVVGFSRSECFSVEAEIYGITPRMTVVILLTSLDRSLISSRVVDPVLVLQQLRGDPLLALDHSGERVGNRDSTLILRNRMGKTMFRPKR